MAVISAHISISLNPFAPESAVTAHADPCPFYCMSQCHYINMSKSSSWPQVKDTQGEIKPKQKDIEILVKSFE